MSNCLEVKPQYLKKFIKYVYKDIKIIQLFKFKLGMKRLVYIPVNTLDFIKTYMFIPISF